MAIIVLIVVPLVVLLYVLIFSMNQAQHFAPQAYYRRKRGGAPVALEFESLGPRPRKELPPSVDNGPLDLSEPGEAEGASRRAG